MDDSLSKHFEFFFSSADVKLIAKKVVEQGKTKKSWGDPRNNPYFVACSNYHKPNCNFLYNFHPTTGAWLGNENRNIEKVQQAVKEEYHRISHFFREHFNPDDVKSIASEVIQLGNQTDRYLVACGKYSKPNCLFRYNSHPETGAWLGSPSENRAIGRVKAAVNTLKTKLRKQHNEQVIREKENQLMVTRASNKSFQRMCAVREKKISKSKNRQLGRLKRECDKTKKVIVSTYMYIYVMIPTLSYLT